MKYILIALLLVGCVDNSQKKPHTTELNNKSDCYDENYTIYSLDGCEYILVGIGSGRWGSHKGNCKNPIHYEHK